jgi:hypothetical protein
MLTDQHRLTILWLVRPLPVLAIMGPILRTSNGSVHVGWYIVGLGIAGGIAVAAYETVLKNRVRRAAARAVRAEYRRML